jgi:hypothetical protein
MLSLFINSKGVNMKKTTYLTIRRSIRENGLRYTAHIAQHMGDIPTLTVCDFMTNTMRQIDWLSMRQSFAKTENPSIAFKMTATYKV